MASSFKRVLSSYESIQHWNTGKKVITKGPLGTDNNSFFRRKT